MRSTHDAFFGDGVHLHFLGAQQELGDHDWVLLGYLTRKTNADHIQELERNL